MDLNKYEQAKEIKDKIDELDTLIHELTNDEKATPPRIKKLEGLRMTVHRTRLDQQFVQIPPFFAETVVAGIIKEAIEQKAKLEKQFKDFE